MIYLSEIRDYVKSLGLFSGYWIGRLPVKRDNTLGVYPLARHLSRTDALGGAEYHTYDVTGINFLIHGSSNKDETERLAWAFYNRLAYQQKPIINGKQVYFVRMLYDCPIDVGSEGESYEYTVQAEFFNERTELNSVTE